MSRVAWTTAGATSTATNIGPLTTIFTPPSSCVSVITMYSSVTIGNGINSGIPNLYLGHFGEGDPACFPLSKPINDFGGDYFYSPGICPYQWTTVPIASGALPPQLGSSALCCPPGFSSSDFFHGCISTPTAAMLLSNVWSATPGYPETFPTTPLSLITVTLLPQQSALVATTSTQGSVSSVITVYPWVTADGVPIMWQSADLALFSQATLSSSASPSELSSSASPSTVASSIVTTSSISATASTHPLPGLSIGAKIGIGVSIPIVVIAIIIGALFSFCRRRRARSGIEAPAAAQYPDKPELYGPAAQNEINYIDVMPSSMNPIELESRTIEAGTGQQVHPYRTSMPSPPPTLQRSSVASPTQRNSSSQSSAPNTAEAYNHARTQDDAEMAAIEESMERLRARKQRLRQLEEIEAQEEEMEERRKAIQRARGANDAGKS
ncbi:hypothetical protein K432DRAFT_424894 [Lepidopterella palustris CBS 459.81]|uniref:Mid2 domain-containing protein n=1 Tax=Lepidopterella palustris CBS 459.81 TaxID=1314670 RepID=A0A8E2JG92_9PEZI|nr:hypothetical protein K432DRAFT_424894 [Lepidopterella palustris CBS 459.81]